MENTLYGSFSLVGSEEEKSETTFKEKSEKKTYESGIYPIDRIGQENVNHWF